MDSLVQGTGILFNGSRNCDLALDLSVQGLTLDPDTFVSLL
jgi:hypothetical protein